MEITAAQKNGTVLLMVLILSSCIMLIATVALRSGTLFYELALDRVAHCKQMHAAQALAYYGIAQCTAMREKKTTHLSCNPWPPSDGPYTGTIAIEPHKRGWRVVATLSTQRDELCTITTEIKQQKGEWRIVDWQMG